MKYCDTCHSAYPDDFAVCPRDQGPLRHASDLLPGMVLRGKYEVLEKIGSGGMAAVYRARHVAFGEICAIKVVGPKLAHDETFLKRFRNEAVVTRKLQHPHAVRVDDLDTTEDGRPFIVMEYVEARNLREVIRQEAPLAPSRAVIIARQVASALSAAHALGIVHRDIKPDNILLARTAQGADHVKVLDFGIAKVKEGVLEAEAYTTTRTGMVVGTPQYVSPEQAMGKRGEEIDGRSDLYSLGIVLYEMLTGRLPFASDTAMGMILHHLQTAPTPPRAARPDLEIPALVSDTLMKALQKEPSARFSSAEEMVAALDELAATLPPPPPVGEAATPRVQSSPLLQPRPTPQPATVPPDQRPTPRPLPTVADDIAERPTRVFPTPAGESATTVMAPAGRRRRVPVAVWIMAGSLLVVFIATRGRSPERASAPPDEAAVDRHPRGDDDLQAAVDRALSRAPITREEEIEVDVEDGVVTLEGRLKNPVAAQVAEALAGSVQGVREVRNRLEDADGKPARAPRPPGGPLAGTHPDPPIPPRGRFPFHRPSPGTPEHEAVSDMLREAKASLARGDHHGAMGIYIGVLALDPTNTEARQGLQETRRRLQGDIRTVRPPVAPTAPPPDERR